MELSWVTAFLDLAESDFDRAVAFWCSVTGYELSPSRGERAEFTTLLPQEGDAFLRVQRLASGTSGIHVDLHAPGQDFEVRASPGGLPYCLVGEAADHRPPAAAWPAGHRSIVDQVCIDIPASRYDDECGFWAEQTGWALQDAGRPEFRRLARPEGMPIGFLLQRLDEADGPVRAHLDLATDDRVAEVRRHEQLGATMGAVYDGWTVMRPPAGPVYCITDRRP